MAHMIQHTAVLVCLRLLVDELQLHAKCPARALRRYDRYVTNLNWTCQLEFHLRMSCRAGDCLDITDARAFPTTINRAGGEM